MYHNHYTKYSLFDFFDLVTLGLGWPWPEALSTTVYVLWNLKVPGTSCVSYLELFVWLLRASERSERAKSFQYNGKISVWAARAGPARPDLAWNAFQRLISQQPLGRLTCGLLCWVAPSLLPHNSLFLMHLGDGRGTCHVKSQGRSRCSAEVAILRSPYLDNRWVDWLAVIFVR